MSTKDGGPALDLEAIRKRCEAATEGPWWWVQNYELFDCDDGGTTRHWGLHNAESEAARSVIDANLVTFCCQSRNGDGLSIAETPNFEFIAHARTDIPLLIAEVERLRPRESSEGQTHWTGCYEARGHHDCAVREVERLKAELASVTEPTTL